MAEAMVDGVHVVMLVEDHAHYQRTRERRNMYLLNERELEQILMSEEIKHLPVAVISVAGVLRSGKSFLLNYFLRYLSATPSARTDGSWLGVPGQQLTGFGWEPGTDRNTTGILMWPKPFIIQIPSGERVAVLLMDTQGTFDDQSSPRDNSTVFALSTLVSSTQIFNIRNNIDECDLMNLELFSQYGQFMKDRTSEKAFQVLEFLIRDWQNSWQYSYGQAGGELYLNNKLQITQSQQKELKDVRKHISSSFDKLTCFLMPHPGLHVSTPSFKTNPEENPDLSPDFKIALKELAHSIFSPEKLCLKRLCGQPVKSSELFEHFKTYVAMFNSNEMPKLMSILEAQSENGLLMAANAARDQFDKNMTRECARSMPAADLIELHNEQLELAVAYLESQHLFGSSQDINNKQEELRQELTNRLDEMQISNNAKTVTAVANGLAAYDAVMQLLTQGQPLCVHTQDLELIHEEALSAAKRVFDENRRTPAAGNTDPDRQRLLEDCHSKNENNKGANAFNNNANVLEVKNTYLQQMMFHCNRDPKLGEAEFHGQHEITLARALEGFQSRRNRPHHYPQDAFKDNLIQEINFLYQQYKQINASSNSQPLQLALLTYYQGSITVSELRNSCLHPDDLKRLHYAAVTSALEVFRPGRPASEGFSRSDPDENILQNLIDRHYEAMVDMNISTNERAVETAFKVYKRNYDALSSHITYFAESWATAKGYHDVAFGHARDAFYDKRRDRTSHVNDRYIQDLEAKCQHYYNPGGRSTHQFAEFTRGLAEAMAQIQNDDYIEYMVPE